MSFKLNISDKDRAAGRFISKVKKELFLAAEAEKVSQQSIADKLGVHRSVINRLLRGSANLTLRSVAEIAWALGWEIVFELRKRPINFASHAITPSLKNVPSHRPLDTFIQANDVYQTLATSNATISPSTNGSVFVGSVNCSNQYSIDHRFVVAA